MTFTFDVEKDKTDDDPLITSELLVRLHTDLLLKIIDDKDCPQSIKDMVEKQLAQIIPLFQSYIGIKKVIKPKVEEDGHIEYGQVVFKNGIRYPFLNGSTLAVWDMLGLIPKDE